MHPGAADSPLLRKVRPEDGAGAAPGDPAGCALAAAAPGDPAGWALADEEDAGAPAVPPCALGGWDPADAEAPVAATGVAEGTSSTRDPVSGFHEVRGYRSTHLSTKV